MRNNSSKGIVLITTLLIIGFLLMFAGGIILTTQRQATMTNQFYHRETALFASQTGINYALMRLNTDPYWMGCTRGTTGITGSDYSFTMGSGHKVNIQEHQVTGNLGAVEGKIDDGNGGYFEIYFVKPEDAKEKLSYFGTGSGKVTLPEKIAISSNRNNQLTTPATNPEDDPSTWSTYSDGSYYKAVPENSILLVCRGTMGNEHKTLEVCIRMGPGEDYNSVAIGRGDIDIAINPSGKIMLDTENTDKPPIIRTKGSINITNGLTSSTDYLSVNGSGGGRASGAVGFTPAPSNNASTFQSGVSIAENMFPPLSWSNVVPETASFGKLNAGYYKLAVSGKNVSVTYYEASTKTEVDAGKAKTITDGTDSLSGLITNGAVTWNSKTNTLEINKSISVESYNTIKNLTITGPDDKAITMELMSVTDAKKGVVNNVYFVNNNDSGNVDLEGSLTGVGTVVVKGNLDIWGESQLSAVEDTGISIYAQGDITINPIKVTPTNLKNATELTSEEVTQLQSAEQVVQAYIDQRNVYRESIGEDPLDRYELTKIDATNVQGQLGGKITEAQWDLLKQTGMVYEKGTGLECIKINKEDVEGAISYGYKIDTSVTNMEGKKVDPKDCKFTGLIFTCKNFNVNVPNNTFALIGGLVAYGGDPTSGATASGSGFININAYSTYFTYDTKYLSMLSGLSPIKIETLYWGSY
ncbi:MAG: hypothetical protein LWY06_11385 [Firmicutes bacterium]|nr:hypothetical protein [Bacillota bacterium]